MKVCIPNSNLTLHLGENHKTSLIRPSTGYHLAASSFSSFSFSLSLCGPLQVFCFLFFRPSVPPGTQRWMPPAPDASVPLFCLCSPPEPPRRMGGWHLFEPDGVQIQRGKRNTMRCLLLSLCFLFSKLLDYAALGKWGDLAGGKRKGKSKGGPPCFSHPPLPSPHPHPKGRRSTKIFGLHGAWNIWQSSPEDGGTRGRNFLNSCQL